jgi:cell division protein FtsI (penicillin-binding protein 3)
MLRLRIGLVLVAMVMSVFAVRLFQIQGLDARAYVARADGEGVTTVTLPATRGTITDRNGVPLAESLDGKMVIADPAVTGEHAPDIARILARRLHVDYFDVLEKLRKPGSRFQYIARRVPSAKADAVVAAVTARGYKGLGTERDPVRDYPSRDVAANIVGYTNAMGDAAEGSELMFDTLLSGTDGSATYETGGGTRIPLGDNSVVPPKSGHDVALTIDRDVQWYTQRVLRAAVQGSGGSSGAAVVMDVQTGELLALADYPSFDANNANASPLPDLGTRAVRDAYEPGSVEKVLTAAALIDSGLGVTPDTKILVPPTLRRSDRVIHDYFSHERLRLTLTGVIAKSSNIGTVLAGSKLTHRQLYRYLRGFGLGRPTGVGIDGESAGVLPPLRDWTQIRHDTITFGQGVAVNALQMAAAVNTIANGGVYVQPSLVKGRVTTSGGAVVGSETSQRRRVVSPRTARLTTQMMEAVTDPDEGTAPAAGIQGYRVAGKTGTAQRVGAQCGCYDGTFTVSFAGFAPADAPRFLVYVVVQDPKNGGGGGSVGGPVFHKVMSYLLQKYAVPPTGSRAPKPRITW